MNGTAGLYGIKATSANLNFIPTDRNIFHPIHKQMPQYFPGFGQSARQPVFATQSPHRHLEPREPHAPAYRKSPVASAIAFATLLLAVYATFHFHLMQSDISLDSDPTILGVQTAALDTPLKTQTVGLYSNGDVNQNSSVVYLRTLFTAYVVGQSLPATHTSHAKEFELLQNWDRSTFHGKFIVTDLSKTSSAGNVITIMFLDNPNQVFQAVVNTNSNGMRELGEFHALSYSPEQVARIRSKWASDLNNRTRAL